MVRLPAYRLHKPSGQAVVTLVCAIARRRVDVYLGEFGTPESLREYARVIREWIEGGRVVERPLRQARRDTRVEREAVTVTRIVRGYMRRVVKRYGDERAARVCSVRSALRVARALFGALPAHEFGPRALARCRRHMIGRGWKRKTINDRIRVIQAAFRWAAARELVPASTWRALLAVEPLRRGDAGAHEGKKVMPAPLAHIEAIRPHLARPARALLDLQLVCGARGGELVIMRACDIDMAGPVWIYRPTRHKGEHRGHTREIPLGPRAQAVIAPFLHDRPIDAYLFCPREGAADRKRATATRGKPRRANQKPTPRKTRRRIGDRYTPDSYRKAIARACALAGVPEFTPHSVRHRAATEIRRLAGLEAAAIVLGHSSAELTDQTYAERDRSIALEAMKRIG